MAISGVLERAMVARQLDLACLVPSDSLGSPPTQLGDMARRAARNTGESISPSGYNGAGGLAAVEGFVDVSENRIGSRSHLGSLAMRYFA